MFTVPDDLTSNKLYCNVDRHALTHVTFRVSLKASKLEIASYIPIQNGSGYSLLELADVHLVIGEAMETLQIQLEGTQRST
jgi:hypothetical protein